MVTIIITTFYHPNLRISLSRLKWLDFDFHLLIHNDNPDVKLTHKDLSTYGYDGSAIILNEEKNVGCYDSRFNSIEYVVENLKDSTHFIFCDDDDTLLYPEFNQDHFVTNHNAFVAHRLKEQLSLLVPNPNIEEALKSEFIEDERPKLGCVGVSYKVSLWREMLPYLRRFKPVLAKVHGSDRILEPDDVYYMNLVREYLTWTRGVENLNDFYYQSPNYSYSLTLLENRVGRYYVEPGVIDLRYGGHDTNETYQNQVNKVCFAFREFLRTQPFPTIPLTPQDDNYFEV